MIVVTSSPRYLKSNQALDSLAAESRLSLQDFCFFSPRWFRFVSLDRHESARRKSQTRSDLSRCSNANHELALCSPARWDSCSGCSFTSLHFTSLRVKSSRLKVAKIHAGTQTLTEVRRSVCLKRNRLNMSGQNVASLRIGR